MLAAVRAVMSPAYELRVIDAGGKPPPWTEARNMLHHARVLFGPHGGGWGNSFFASNVEGETHLIEFQQLHGRQCTPDTVHYMGSGGWPRLWEIEPKLVARDNKPLSAATKFDPATYGATVAEHNKMNEAFGHDYVLPLAPLVNILVLAGVAHCPGKELRDVKEDNGRPVRCVEYASEHVGGDVVSNLF